MWLGRAEKEKGGEQHFSLIWKRGRLHDAFSPLFSFPYTVKRKEKSPTKKEQPGRTQWLSMAKSILHFIAILYKNIYEADASEISELDKTSGKRNATGRCNQHPPLSVQPL